MTTRCVGLSGTSVRPAPPASSWTASSGWSTAGTTPRASRSWPTGCSRSGGAPAGCATWRRCSGSARSTARSGIGHTRWANARPAVGGERSPAHRLHGLHRRRAQRHPRELSADQGQAPGRGPPVQVGDRHGGAGPPGRAVLGRGGRSCRGGAPGAPGGPRRLRGRRALGPGARRARRGQDRRRRRGGRARRGRVLRGVGRARHPGAHARRPDPRGRRDGRRRPGRASGSRRSPAGRWSGR